MNIKDLRKRKGLSQRQLSAYFACCVTKISNIENGKDELNEFMLNAIPEIEALTNHNQLNHFEVTSISGVRLSTRDKFRELKMKWGCKNYDEVLERLFKLIKDDNE